MVALKLFGDFIDHAPVLNLLTVTVKQVIQNLIFI